MYQNLLSKSRVMGGFDSEKKNSVAYEDSKRPRVGLKPIEMQGFNFNIKDY